MKNINKKNTIKIIFIIGTILMLTSAIIVLLEKTILKNNKSFLKTNNSNNNLQENEQFNNNKIKSFFLLENFKYAIYRTDGKKVTDFKYKYNNGYYSKFRNGYAPVRYLDDEYAIVDENGKEVIKKGQYKEIKYSGGRYLLIGKNGEKSKLLDLKLNIIMEQENLDMLSDIVYDNLTNADNLQDYDINNLYILTDYKKVYIYSPTGKLMHEIDYKKDIVVKNNFEPFKNNCHVFSRCKAVDDIKSFSYDNKLYIFDVKKEKLVFSMSIIYRKPDSSPAHIYLTDYINLNSFLIKDRSGKYYIVYDGRLVGESKESLSVKNYYIYDDNLIYKKNGEVAFPKEDENFKRLYIDGDNYLKQVKGSKKIEIYVDGKLKNTIDGIIDFNGSSMEPNNSYGYYRIRTVDDKDFLLLDREGNILMKYYRIFKVNSVENSVLVYNNGKHYYVDLKDKIISPKSENDNIIRLGSKFYCANKDGSNYNLTDCKTNKTIYSYKSISTKYNNVYKIVKFNGQEYVVFKNKDKYALFNITKNKIVFESKEAIYLTDEYYEVGQNEKTKYYSYLTNKKFYEYEKK